MADSRSDHAPVDVAYAAILDPLSDVALRNAQKFSDAGVGRLSTFRVETTVASQFQPGKGDAIVALLDTDEKGTRPLTIVFEIAGTPPKPKVD